MELKLNFGAVIVTLVMLGVLLLLLLRNDFDGYSRALNFLAFEVTGRAASHMLSSMNIVERAIGGAAMYVSSFFSSIIENALVVTFLCSFILSCYGFIFHLSVMKDTISEAITPLKDAVKEIWQTLKETFYTIYVKLTFSSLLQAAISLSVMSAFPFTIQELSKLLNKSVSIK